MKALLLALVAAAACSHDSAPSAPAKPEPPPATGAVGAMPAQWAKGTVQRTHFHSAALGVDKDVVVYLPAGYDAAPAKRWPVYYYLHGLTGNETNWVDAAHLDQAADGLALAAIVVMPDGDDDFYIDTDMPIDYDACIKSGTGLLDPRVDRAKQCVHARKYETYMTKDLIAWVDGTYRTLASRDARGIAGLSMGGYGALMLATRHPDLFAAAASHSGVVSLLYKGPRPYAPGKVELVMDVTHWGQEMGPLGAWFRGLYGPDVANWRAYDPGTLLGALQPGKLALYLDCGTEDDFGLFDPALYVHDVLTQHKIEHDWYIGPGRHDMKFWTERLPKSLAFMQQHVAAAK